MLFVYRDTFRSVVDTWDTNSTFSHGFLIVPLCLWLAWRNRAGLVSVECRPSWPGALVVVGCVAAWVVGRGVGVLGFEQAAAIALVPALTLAICGVGVVRVMAMPLAYLTFAVPIGHALVPLLMHTTADVATWALKLSLVPVHRSDMYISIPDGKFEVARACSGLNYVVTGLALGALYSYLTYAGWRKRLLSMVAFVVVPVFANGLRVYLTILISHFTHMRFGPGAEHVWFGRAFFIMVMLAMFWVGRRWGDDVAPPVAGAPPQPMHRPVGAGWAAFAVAILAICAGPPYLASATTEVERQLAGESARVAFGGGRSGWAGPIEARDSWKPLYSGARSQGATRYTSATGEPVDVYVAVYGLGTSGGAEMVSYQNRIFLDEHRSLGRDNVRRVALGGLGGLRARDLQVDDDSGRHRVWYWFMVGRRTMTSPYAVKVHEALAFLTRRAVTERIVTLATPESASDERTLGDFAAAHAVCLRSGFSAEACVN